MSELTGTEAQADKEPLDGIDAAERLPADIEPVILRKYFSLTRGDLAEDVVVDGELEHVPVVALRWYGRRLSVVLARPRQKRCDFQIVDKVYKHPEPGGPTTYEQIF